MEQLLSLEKSGYVCFSDYHTGFTGRFNIYDLVLEKPFFKGWYCHIIASFVKHLWPPHFLFLSANMIQNRYDLRKMCILLQLWKSEIGRFNLTSSWGLAPRNLQEIFNLHPEKMARGRGRGEGGQLNIFFLQNNFLWCLTFSSPAAVHKTLIQLLISGIIRTDQLMGFKSALKIPVVVFWDGLKFFWDWLKFFFRLAQAQSEKKQRNYTTWPTTKIIRRI